MPRLPLAIAATAIVYAACLTQAAPAEAQTSGRPPGDGEIRTTEDDLARQTVTTLTLVLRNAEGELPITMVLTSRQPMRGSDAPVALGMHLDMPRFTGASTGQYRQMSLTLNPGTPGESEVSYAIDPRRSWPATTSTHLRFDRADFDRLAAADAVRGEVFGLTFELTRSQVRAIDAFAGRLSRAP